MTNELNWKTQAPLTQSQLVSVLYLLPDLLALIINHVIAVTC